MSEPAIIEAEVGDRLAVRRHDGIHVRTVALGELCQRAAGEIDRMDVAVYRIQLPVVAAIDRQQQALAVRCEGQCATVVEFTVGQLSRRAAFSRYQEYVAVTALQVALAVDPIHDVIDHCHGWRPVGAFGFLRRFGERRLLGHYELRKSEHATIWRPGEVARRFGQVGQQCRLAGVHPAHEQLRLALGIGNVGNTRAVGGPAGRAVVVSVGAQRTVLRAVGIDYPQVGPWPVRHHVVAAAYIDDLFAVW